jgi:hypothetical protein
MKKCKARRCIVSLFINLGTRRTWVSLTPRPLYPRGKCPQCPSNRRLVRHHSRSGCFGEEINSFFLPEVLLDLPALAQ